MSLRFLAFLSTIFLVVGALLVGQAIHGGVVTGSYPVTSPWVVLRALLGMAFIALGYRFQTPHEEYLSMPSREVTRSDGTTGESGESDDPDETGNFDSDLSPLGDEGLEHVDADDDRTE